MILYKLMNSAINTKYSMLKSLLFFWYDFIILLEINKQFGYV